MAKEYGSTPFTDYRVMVEKAKPEFIVALGRHRRDAGGVPLSRRNADPIPDGEAVGQSTIARSSSLPTWRNPPRPGQRYRCRFRYSLFAETAIEMRDRRRARDDVHMLFRFNQPGVSTLRRPRQPVDVVEGRRCGGALINLGIHGFDLCRYITGEEPKVIAAVTSHSIHKREIEDYAHVTLRTPSGLVFLNEASYTFSGHHGWRSRAEAVGREGCPARNDDRR
jgi:hypothetical protein